MPTAERESPEGEPAAPAKADLTVNKVLAGAGAAVTSAVLGSYFGATGTVLGAALGSVASTVSTTLYQRSLDRTRDTIVARVRLGTDRRTVVSDAPTVQLTVPEPRVSADAGTVQLHVEPAIRRPRRTWVVAGVAVLVFAIGLLVVTGLEWAKGSSLTTGQPGTSVGRVLAPPPGDHEGRESTESTSEAPTPTADPTSTDEATSSAEPSAEFSPTVEPSAGAERTRDPARTTTPLPTLDVPIPDGRQND